MLHVVSDKTHTGRRRMESILALRNVLLAALSSSGADDFEQELFDELTVNKSRLLHVFNFGPRSAQELKEVESGASDLH